VSDYPEAEEILVTALAAHFTSARVCTETPDNLADVLPCIRVTRFAGGSDPVYTFDNPSIDFDCYAASRGAARKLAYDVRTYVRQTLVGSTVEITDANDAVTGRAFVARAQDILGPHWTPYDNTSLRRFTYSAALRLHALDL